MFEIYLQQAFVIVVVVSGLPLLASSLCGLGVALLQALTQIQEQSISYLVRFGAVGVVMAVTFPWLAAEVMTFTREILGSLGALGRMP